MSEALDPKEIALAAAQGVAIALNARKPKAGGKTEELLTKPVFICGIPTVLFEATLSADSRGSYSVGEIKSKNGA